MSTYLDLETDAWGDDEDRTRREWVTVKCEHRVVNISREHTARDGSRRVDPEAGICLHVTHLDAFIEALVRLRGELPGSDT